MFKILNLIFVKVPESSSNYELGIPYNNYLWYETGRIINKKIYEIRKPLSKCFRERKAMLIKHIEPNTAIRYHIIGKIFNYVIIKIN